MSHSLPDRLHALDAVRAFALLLGVALHASLSYLPGAAHWWIIGDDASTPLAVFFYWIHCFRMPLFFLIAGYFGRLLLQRLGLRAFVRDRLRRIVGVLLSAWPMVISAIVAVLMLAAIVKNGGTAPNTPPPPPLSATNFPLTHLWFLYVLAIFYAGALALRGLVGKLDGNGRIMRRVDAMANAIVGPGVAIVLALPAAIALATTAKWPMWFGVPTPDTGLFPNVAALVAYGMAFGSGWLLQRQPALLGRIANAGWSNLLLAIGSTVACLALVGPTPMLQPSAADGTKLVYAGVYALSSWAWALALLGLALRYLNGYSPLRRYLADASYWVYIVHIPLVMALQVCAFKLGLPWWLEYPLLLSLAMALMLASYEGFVRHGRLGRWLNGKPAPRTVTPAIRAVDVAV